MNTTSTDSACYESRTCAPRGFWRRVTHKCSMTIAASVVAACGGSIDERARVETIQAGPTPFISLVTLRVDDVQAVSSVRFRISPKAGTASKPVDVTYGAAALTRRQYVNRASHQLTVPVFGLYAGTTNAVTVDVEFVDRLTQSLAVQIDTNAYSDPTGIYDRPNVLKARQPETDLGLDFFALKSRLVGPIVLDTDGNVRWVGSTGLLDGQWSGFDKDAFVIGSRDSTRFSRLELDGRVTHHNLQSPTYTKFHHNIDPGKVGLLGEVDKLSDGVEQIESILVEFSADGSIVSEWDLAQIIANYMQSQGDDASAFVRPGVDWFHMNASVYDPRDDTVIVSSRENFVVKLDYRTGEVVWIFGDPSLYWYTFPSLRAKAIVLEAGGLYPIGQHSVSLTADGHLMLFNNGFPSQNQPAGAPAGNTRGFSAVSAYSIDRGSRTAREVWRFDDNQSIYSAVCSSVYETRQRSILVNFAKADSGTKVRLMGLSPERQVVFDLEYPNTTGCDVAWNAVPVPLEGMTVD